MLKELLDLYELKLSEFVCIALCLKEELMKVLLPYIGDLVCVVGVGPVFSFVSKEREDFDFEEPNARRDLSRVLEEALKLESHVGGVYVWHFDAPFGVRLKIDEAEKIERELSSLLKKADMNAEHG